MRAARQVRFLIQVETNSNSWTHLCVRSFAALLSHGLIHSVMNDYMECFARCDDATTRQRNVKVLGR